MNYFMINLDDSYVIELGFEVANPGSAVRPKVIKLFSCSTQLSMKFHLVMKIPKNFSCSTQLS